MNYRFNIFFMLSLLFMGLKLNAQQVISLTEFRGVEANQKEEVESFKRMVFDNVPTLYLNHEESIEQQLSASRIITDLDSWDKLVQVDNPESIELIILRVHNKEELLKKIDMGLLNRFVALRYVFVSGDFPICEGQPTDCEINLISKIFKGKTAVDVIYDFQTIN